MAAVDNEVINFDVLDLAQDRDLIYVFATKQLPGSTLRRLEMIQIAYDALRKEWKFPA